MGLRRRERELYWRGVIERQAASGMSVAAYCRQESIAAANFYAWRRKLRRRDQAPAQPGGTEVNAAGGPARSGLQLLPVRLEPSTQPAPLRILLPHGVCVETSSSLPQGALTAVLRALREVAVC